MACNSLNATGQSPRIPKLPVRNRIPEDELGNQPSVESDQTASSYSEVNAENEGSKDSSLPWSMSDGGEVPRSDMYLTQPNQQSPDEDVRSDVKVKSGSKKKKGGGVIGFLTLKEPSTKAWEEFATVEREKAKQARRASSSQKLPDHVPKVNSKWDGMPDSTKNKRTVSKCEEKSKRNSVSSANLGWPEGSAASIRTESWSTQSTVHTSSNDQNVSIQGPPSQRLVQPQLETLPELSPIPSKAVTGDHDTENQIESSSGPESTLEESPPASRENDHELSPVVGVHQNASQAQPKPINFSRPLQRPPQV